MFEYLNHKLIKYDYSEVHYSYECIVCKKTVHIHFKDNYYWCWNNDNNVIEGWHKTLNCEEYIIKQLLE